MSTFRRWLIMACLCLSGGIIYLLPFLREVYYIPLQKALHLTNTQLGVLMSVFGITAMISYFPGALGYRYFFAFIAGLCVFGLLAALTIKQKLVKRLPD